MSPGRSASRSRRATPISSWSPAAWPAMSFTDLNRSMSMKSTAEWIERRAAASIDWVMRSTRRIRLGSPVRASWRAWWVSRPCSSSSLAWSSPRWVSKTLAMRTIAESEPTRADMTAKSLAEGSLWSRSVSSSIMSSVTSRQ